MKSGDGSLTKDKKSSSFLMLRDFIGYEVTYANQTVLGMLGVSSMSRLTDFLSTKEARDLVEVTKRNSPRFDFRCVLITNTGTYISAVLRFVIIAGIIYVTIEDHNEDCGYVKRLEFEYDRASALIELTGCILAEFNTEGSLTYATSSFVEHFNISDFNCGVINALRSRVVFSKDYSKAARLIRSDFTMEKIYEEELRVKVGTKYVWFKISAKGIVDSRGILQRVILKLEDIDIYKVKEKLLKLRVETDELTQCYKKSFLLSELSRDVLTKGCLAFFDIDNFKGINDSYGHLEGDTSLREVSRLCRELFSEDEDIVCRFGGDEFCIFSKNSTRDEFEHKIQILQSRICRVKISGETPLSISVGIAVVSTCLSDIQTLLDVADETLYTVKEHGKNSYKFFDELR